MTGTNIRSGIRRAIDLVRFEPADAAIARHLLGRTIVVDDLTSAARSAGARARRDIGM